MNARLGYGAARESRVRAPRRRRRRAWGGEALEGRALLSVYLVDSPGDAGAGTGFAGDLRYVIRQADQATGDSTVVFAPYLFRQTIALTSGMLAISKPSGTLTIQGLGADALTISGGNHGQVFTVSPVSNVTINGLTITGGIGPQGGGIRNDGKLVLNDCTITGNTAFGQGGGGISNGINGTVTLAASTVGGNLSNLADGGGIANAGTMTIIRSTIDDNTSHVANGGGIANAGSLVIVDSTLSGNRAIVGSGGGISNTSALAMLDDTVSDNAADFSGGGLANRAIPSGSVFLGNSIVADNVCVQNPRTADVIDKTDFDGSHLVGHNDLIGSGDLGSLSATLVGVDPRLGPLKDNGGPTWTQALLAGSPAISAGDAALVPARVTTDQRGEGYARINQGLVDIGAFEVQGPRRPFTAIPRVLPRVPLSTEAIVGLTIVPPGPASAAGRSPTDTAGA